VSLLQYNHVGLLPGAFDGIAICDKVDQELPLTVSIIILAPTHASECKVGIEQPWSSLLEQLGPCSVTVIVPQLPFECQSWHETVERTKQAAVAAGASLVLVPCGSESVACSPALQLSSMASVIKASVTVLIPWTLLRLIQPYISAQHHKQHSLMSQLRNVFIEHSDIASFCAGGARVVKLPPPSESEDAVSCALTPYPGVQSDRISIFPTFALRQAATALAAASDLCSRVAGADEVEGLTLQLLADHLFGIALVWQAQQGCSSGMEGWTVLPQHDRAIDLDESAADDLDLPPFEKSLVIYYT
jgi:hypothetical protein